MLDRDFETPLSESRPPREGMREKTIPELSHASAGRDVRWRPASSLNWIVVVVMALSFEFFGC
jgi:hypothetical protein